MFDNINIDPEAIEFVLSYVVPAAIALLFVALGAFGFRKTLDQVVAFWRSLRPLVDEEHDPAIIALARALHMTPAQVVAIFKAIGDQIDPSAPPTPADEAAK